MPGGIQIGDDGIVIGDDGVVVTDADDTPCCCEDGGPTCPVCPEAIHRCAKINISGVGSCPSFPGVPLPNVVDLILPLTQVDINGCGWVLTVGGIVFSVGLVNSGPTPYVSLTASRVSDGIGLFVSN